MIKKERRFVMKIKSLSLVNIHIFIALLTLLCPSVFADELICEGPTFSDKDILEIVERERATRKVVPAKFKEEVEIKIHRKRCHYVYVEFPKKKTVGRNRVIVLSRYGYIVDAYSGRSNSTFLNCPDVSYSAEDLQNFVNKQRKQYKDLPDAPKEYAIKMSKMRCMFVYYETPIPEQSNNYQSFTLDYYGDVYEFYQSK